MRSLKLLVVVLGVIIAAIGLLGVTAPSVLLEFGRSLQTPSALYVIAAVRVTFGALLLWVASASRMPRTLRVIGSVIIIAGLLTPFIGIERAQAILDWWVGQGLAFTRAWAGLAVFFGFFIVYVVASPRRVVA
jgi:hypothetical protein